MGSKSFLRYTVKMSGWLNILIMHVNTNKLSIQNLLFAADLLELLQTAWILESREILRKAEMEGLAELSVLSWARGKQQWTMQAFLGAEKIKYLGTCTSGVICCSAAEGKPMGSQVLCRWLSRDTIILC